MHVAKANVDANRTKAHSSFARIITSMFLSWSQVFPSHICCNRRITMILLVFISTAGPFSYKNNIPYAVKYIMERDETFPPKWRNVNGIFFFLGSLITFLSLGFPFTYSSYLGYSHCKS